MNKPITIDFSIEELQAVVNLIEYAMKDISKADESLIEVVWNKFNINLQYNKLINDTKQRQSTTTDLDNSNDSSTTNTPLMYYSR